MTQDFTRHPGHPRYHPRYQRQMVLPEIGAAGQELLSQARVLIVGVGGLGSPLALYLTAAGVGELGLIDPDRVDLSNLQRQILFNSEQAGKPKVEAARETLRALNPEVRIRTYDETFSPENAREIVAQYDLVVDGTDNFAAKFLIGDITRALGIPLVHGTVSAFEGRVAVFTNKEGPCFRCLYPELPRQKIANCAEAGVLGAVAGVIGSFQAIEAIKLIVNPENRDSSRTSMLLPMLVIDAWNLEPRVFEIARRTDCAFCCAGFDPLRPEYRTQALSCDQKIPLELSPEDLLTLPEYTLVDIREPAEWNKGHIHGAMHWPLMKIISGNQEFESDRHYILYCHSGVRSASVLDHLHQQGIRNVSHLRGGILSWPDPLER